MDTLRIGAIRYKNIDWLCLGKTPGAAAQDGRPKKKEKGGFLHLLPHGKTLTLPAFAKIMAESPLTGAFSMVMLSVIASITSNPALEMIAASATLNLTSNNVVGAMSVQFEHNESPSRFGWPTSYLCIHYSIDLGKCKMAK